MTQEDFNASFRKSLIDAPAQSTDVGSMAEKLYRREHFRMKILAAFSIFFWLLFAAGMFLLVVGLEMFFQSIRQSAGAAGGGGAITVEDLQFWSTDVIHRSAPFILGSVVALPLAALCTLMVAFSSRRATLKRINLSLMQISARLSQGQPASTVAVENTTRIAPRRRTFRNALFAWLILLFLIAAAAISYTYFTNFSRWQGYPDLAPYQGIRWEQETPQVDVNGEWYQLIAVDDVPVDQIIAKSKSMGPEWWQKHFNEDLVELMTLMGHRPAGLVSLRVKKLGETSEQVLSNLRMTWQNRQAILSDDFLHPLPTSQPGMP